jgi:hypothetical protein
MDKKIKRCSCGVAEGHFHIPGCEFERCPFCGGQLISCECSYEKLGLLDRKKFRADTNYLPRRTFENGLTQSQQTRWDVILRKKGLVPYIEYPIVCGRCGALWPHMFMVSDAEWEYYIPIAERRLILCLHCYEEIRALIDKAVGSFPGPHELRMLPRESDRDLVGQKDADAETEK